MIKSNLSAAARPAQIHSILTRILVNYLQIIMLTSTFKLEWPSYVLELFKVQETAGSAMEHLLSLDCYLESSDDAGVSVYYNKLLVMSALPFIIILISFTVWGLYALWK
jgi:hypothetical protein